MKSSIYLALLLLLANLLSNNLFFNKLINSKKNYISIQLKYFIFKTIIFFSITYFFCFFSPSNRVKFILLGLVIFIVFHFTEAIVIQKRLEEK